MRSNVLHNFRCHYFRWWQQYSNRKTILTQQTIMKKLLLCVVALFAVSMSASKVSADITLTNNTQLPVRVAVMDGNWATRQTTGWTRVEGGTTTRIKTPSIPYLHIEEDHGNTYAKRYYQFPSSDKRYFWVHVREPFVIKRDAGVDSNDVRKNPHNVPLGAPPEAYWLRLRGNDRVRVPMSKNVTQARTDDAGWVVREFFKAKNGGSYQINTLGSPIPPGIGWPSDRQPGSSNKNTKAWRDQSTGLEWTVSQSRTGTFASAKQKVAALGFRLPMHTEFRTLEKSGGIKKLGMNTDWLGGFYWEASGNLVNGNGGRFSSLFPPDRLRSGDPYAIGVR